MCSPDAGNLQEKEETNRGKQFGGLTIDQRTLRWSCGLLYVNVLQKTANDLQGQWSVVNIVVLLASMES